MIRLPYPLLVGPLSGFLSLVPYVGLPLALMPPMFVALAQATSFGYFIIFLIVAALPPAGAESALSRRSSARACI